MTARIYLTSAEGHTGKSTVALGVLEALRERFPRVGVFRPIARSRDEGDYVLELLRARATVDAPSADCLGTSYDAVHTDSDAALADILERYAALEARCDAVVILGSDYTDVSTPTELAFNARVAATLAAPVLLVLGGRTSDERGARTADELGELAEVTLQELEHEHAEAIAIVVTRANPAAVDAIAVAVARGSGRRELPAWVLPEDPYLVAPSLSAILDATGSTLVMGDPALLDSPVLGTTVAAMTLENVLPRLVERGVVVVPGDRSDVLVGTVVAHLSSSSPALSGIILNGGFELAPSIRHLLDGLHTELPIAATPASTFETAVAITRTRSRLAAESPAKAAAALALFRDHVDAARLLDRLAQPRPEIVTPVRFEHALLGLARRSSRRIVLPEGDDDRVLQAAARVLERGIAQLTILGDEAAIRRRAGELGLDLGAAQVLSTHDPELVERFATEYARLRAHKGATLESARQTVTDVSYFGTMMIHEGLADGMVSGATHTTAHTIRPAFEIVKTAPGVDVVSSVFLMALADRVLVYGDCAVIPEPTAEQLADIAISSAATATLFGIEPRIAMLSYSTGDSGSGADVDKVRAATALVHERRPDLAVDGPMQYDAAADPAVGRAKLPGSAIAGHATVFVFPDLNTGNNTYKAVQRSSGAVAIGPVLQGLAKPINDLSRGAEVRDIVNTIAITAIQAQGAAS